MSDEPTISVSEGGYELPVVEVLTGRGVIFGKSGSGKSNSLGVIAEELLEQGFPLCIVDADGEHYGLKEEYELLHVGGDDSVDVQIGPEHAERLAEVMLHEDVPVILDISGYIDEDEADELVERVVTKLFSMEKKAKKPFPVFVEEVHEAVPEQNNPDSLAATLIRVAKRGRKHGLGIVGASQRPAEVKKSFVTQASWSIWHKLTWSQDTNVVKDIIDKEHAEAVQDLDIGQAIVMADWNDDVRTIQFRRKHTFDAGATPGLEEFTTPELKGVSDDVIDALESITDEKEAEEDELDSLRDEVERLRAENEELEQELDRVASETATDPEKVEALTAQAERLRAERDDLQDELDHKDERINDQEVRIKELKSEVGTFKKQVENQEEAIGHLKAALDSLDVEVPERDDDIRERIEELESERDRLREQLEKAESEGAEVVMDDADYMDFLDNDAVKDAIETAKDESTPKYVRGVIGAVIEEGGPVSYDDIAQRLNLAQTNHVSSAATTLEALGVVEKVDMGSGKGVDLNLDGIEEIIALQRKRERTEEVMDRI